LLEQNKIKGKNFSSPNFQTNKFVAIYSVAGAQKMEGAGEMELRMHFPPWATKRMRFAAGATVGDALRALAARHAHALPPPGDHELADNRRVAGDEKDEDRDGQEEEEEEEGHYYHGDFGLFIPRWANERVSGWLGGEDATLAGLGLRSGDVVECRPRRHRLTLLLPYTSSSSSSSSLTSSASAISAAEAQQPRLLRVTTPTALTIARLLPRLLRVPPPSVLPSPVAFVLCSLLD
jgi:hypothetical protein